MSIIVHFITESEIRVSYWLSLIDTVVPISALQGVTDLVLQVCQLLRQDLQELIDGMEEVKPWDEG